MRRRDLLKSGGALTLYAAAGQPGRAGVLAKAKPLPPGPFQPTWESIRDNYRPPAWFREAKFGIFIHWGLYSIPAHGNEWYSRHMYTSDVRWHTEHYGPPDKFGYKDFIPLFKAEKYDPAAWALLFKQAGARYVMPVAEHHDGFAMWDSDLTEWCAGKMGPKRDLIGDLAKAVRGQNLIFCASSHRMEHHTFMYPAAGVPNDQFGPKYAGFYGPPVPGNMNDGNASPEFQEDWLARCQELIDKYQPQMLYFDNGVNDRAYDKVKLQAAAYYYNRAREWKKEASLCTKDVAYAAGSIPDFEKSNREPRWIYPGEWQVDDAIGTTWGYTTEIRYRPAQAILQEMVDIASKGGNLLLNISPRGDGTIPEEQQTILKSIGEWMRANGEAIYGSRAWRVYGEGPSVPAEVPADWRGGSSAQPGPLPPKRMPPFTEQDYRYTANHGSLYAFGMGMPEPEAVLQQLGKRTAEVKKVTLVGTGAPLPFEQQPDALRVKLGTLPAQAGPFVLKIEGTEILGA